MPHLHFHDKRIHNDNLNYLGFTKIEGMDRDMLRDFYKESKEVIREAKKAHNSGELLALISADHHLKLQSNALVAKYLNKHLSQFFGPEEADIYPVSHIIKPFGLKSGICHQDSTIVEEIDGHFSLNAWMPFVDSNRLNGCIWVLPGSHTFQNYYRTSLSSPFFKRPITNTIWKKMQPVHCKAGEILLFHRSLIHGSSRNYLPWSRYAAESVIISKGAPFVQYRYEHEISEQKIVRYEVPFEHFMKPVPKESFSNKIYPYELRDCETEDEIVDKLYNSFTSIEDYAQMKNTHLNAKVN